jgi:hypothetical protein
MKLPYYVVESEGLFFEYQDKDAAVDAFYEQKRFANYEGFYALLKEVFKTDKNAVGFGEQTLIKYFT